MRATRIGFGIITIIFGIQLSYAESPDMRPGKWEVSMEVDMTGMPQQIPPMTSSHCLTPEQAREPGKEIMEKMKHAQQGGQNCKITQQTITKKTAKWTMECSGAQSIQSEGEITFDSDVAYHGEIRSEVQTPAGPMSMMQTIQARRIGECDK